MIFAQPIVTIVPAVADARAAEDISAIITDNFEHDPLYKDYDPVVLNSYIVTNTPDRVLENMRDANSRCFVAYVNGQIVGAIFLRFYPTGYPDEESRDAWRIRRMHVAADRRGLGVAVGLVEEAERFVASQGYAVIYAEPTPEAALFFCKLGWTGVDAVKTITYRDAELVQCTVDVPRFRASKRL